MNVKGRDGVAGDGARGKARAASAIEGGRRTPVLMRSSLEPRFSQTLNVEEDRESASGGQSEHAVTPTRSAKRARVTKGSMRFYILFT